MPSNFNHNLQIAPIYWSLPSVFFMVLWCSYVFYVIKYQLLSCLKVIWSTKSELDTLCKVKAVRSWQSIKAELCDILSHSQSNLE